MDSVENGGALPEQHEDQLQLGFRMIQNAFNNKVHHLEQELHRLRINHEDQKTQTGQLQRKNSSLEVELVESHQRAQQLAEENKELFKTVNQLKRQIARLEDLKKKVMSSIQDDQSLQMDGDSTNLYMNDDYMKGAMPLTYSAYGEGGQPLSAQQLGQQQQHAARPTTPQQTAALAPDGGNYRSPWSAPGAAPMPAAGAAAVSAPGGGPAPGTAIDGKQFFRMARNNLSYELFNEFLANIKRLNNQQQTREETLEEARRIFGSELQHLYKEFEQLLNRHSV